MKDTILGRVLTEDCGKAAEDDDLKPGDLLIVNGNSDSCGGQEEAMV